MVPSPSFPPALLPHNPTPFPTHLISVPPQHCLKFCSFSLDQIFLCFPPTPQITLSQSPQPSPFTPATSNLPRPQQNPSPPPSSHFSPSPPLQTPFSNFTQHSPTPFPRPPRCHHNTNLGLSPSPSPPQRPEGSSSTPRPAQALLSPECPHRPYPPPGPHHPLRPPAPFRAPFPPSDRHPIPPAPPLSSPHRRRRNSRRRLAAPPISHRWPIRREETLFDQSQDRKGMSGLSPGPIGEQFAYPQPRQGCSAPV